MSLGLITLIATAFLTRPFTARAGDLAWPLEDAAQVLTAFGATYSDADGQAATHRGVDLAASQADVVLAPCTGTVRFVGRIPALGSSGTQLALTVESDDGVRFTLMPLESACEVCGARVEVGATLGGVAASGDGSSADPHLHVSARRGELYVDPLQFLRPAATWSNAGDGPSGVVAPEPGPTPAGSAAHATGVASGAPAGSGAARMAAAGAESAVLTPRDAGTPVVNPTGLTAADPKTTTGGTTARATGPTGDTLAAAGAPRVAALALGGAAQPVNVAALRSPVADLLASLVSRGVPAAAGSLKRLVRAWFVAAIALLAAAGALWPLWRRTPSVGEPGSCIAPVGSEIAAAAGR